MTKRTFRLALASAGINQAEFARRHHITPQVLAQQLNGKPISRRISKLIERFAAEQLQLLAKELTDAA